MDFTRPCCWAAVSQNLSLINNGAKFYYGFDLRFCEETLMSVTFSLSSLLFSLFFLLRQAVQVVFFFVLFSVRARTHAGAKNHS